MNMQTAFQIALKDNVATALCDLSLGQAVLRGDTQISSIEVTESVPIGHKIALRPISEGEKIYKYGVSIGCATRQISTGEWVHLHCMRSLYDERSSHLDVVTGAPKDIKYE